MIHHATLDLEGELTHWVSLDGDDWLPVSRPPAPGDDEAEIQRLFDGDGNFMPMRMGRRYLEYEGADFKVPTG